MSDGNCDFSRICTQSLVPKLGFCRSEFGLSGLKMTDFGRNGHDLILISVNFERDKLCYFYKQNDAF